MKRAVLGLGVSAAAGAFGRTAAGAAIATLVALAGCSVDKARDEGAVSAAVVTPTKAEAAPVATQRAIEPVVMNEVTARGVAICDEYVRRSAQCSRRLDGDAFAEKRARLEKQRASLVARARSREESIEVAATKPLAQACKRALAALPTECRP